MISDISININCGFYVTIHIESTLFGLHLNQPVGHLTLCHMLTCNTSYFSSSMLTCNTSYFSSSMLTCNTSYFSSSMSTCNTSYFSSSMLTCNTSYFSSSMETSLNIHWNLSKLNPIICARNRQVFGLHRFYCTSYSLQEWWRLFVYIKVLKVII